MPRKVALRRSLRGRETFYGNVENTEDALRIIGACREGVLKRAVMRLPADECMAIRPGSVFVFDEEESGIKRWTDGKVWSPSRILGNWLVYRELERKIGRRAGGGPNCSGVPNELKNSGLQVIGSTKGTFVVKGPGGLLKKTFSVSNGNSTTHLVTYLLNEHSTPEHLPRPSDFPDLLRIHVHQESARAQRFRRQKSRSSSSALACAGRPSAARKKAAAGGGGNAGSKQAKPPKRARDSSSSSESDEAGASPAAGRPSSLSSSSPPAKRRPNLRAVPARAKKGKNFYQDDDEVEEDDDDDGSDSESSAGSEYVASDAEDDLVEEKAAREPLPARAGAVPEPTAEGSLTNYGTGGRGGSVPPGASQENRHEGDRRCRELGRPSVKNEDHPEPRGIEARGAEGVGPSYGDEDAHVETEEVAAGGGVGSSGAGAAVSPILEGEFGRFGRPSFISPPPPLAADPYLFDSDDAADDSLLSGNMDSAGSEDSSFIVEYMCSRGYPPQQFSSASFEPDMPMLDACARLPMLEA